MAAGEAAKRHRELTQAQSRLHHHELGMTPCAEVEGWWGKLGRAGQSYAEASGQ